MNDESYKNLMNDINKKILKISEITLKMAELGSANNDNPAFVAVMKNYEELSNSMVNVIDEYEKFLETEMKK